MWKQDFPEERRESGALDAQFPPYDERAGVDHGGTQGQSLPRCIHSGRCILLIPNGYIAANVLSNQALGVTAPSKLGNEGLRCLDQPNLGADILHRLSPGLEFDPQELREFA